MNSYKQTKRTLLLALVILLTQVGSIWGQAAGHYGVTWWTIDNGDGLRTGGNYVLDGTTGQPDAGSFSSGLYSLNGGFWAIAGAKPPADPVDLIAQKLEVTQGIQDLNNSVRLVAHKRTFVRFHVRANNGRYRTFAQLRVQSNAKPDIWLSPLNVDRGHINVSANPNRAALNDAFLFELPSSYAEGAVTLTGEVNPLTPWRFRDPAEQDVNNNSVVTTINFETVPPLHLVVYGVGYGQQNFLPSQFHIDHLTDWLREAYPLNTMQVQQRTLYQGIDLPNCRTINANLAAIRLQDLTTNWVIRGTHYYGMVDDRGGVMPVSCAADIPAFVASGATGTPAPTGKYRSGWDTDGSYGDFLGGHELGHAYGRRHTRCLGGEGGPDDNYPHPDGRISPTLTGDTAIYGINVDSKAIYSPLWKDVMSYCEFVWISDYTYEHLLDFFQQTPVLAANRQTVDQTDRLLVTGVIDLQTNQVQLQPLFVLSNASDVQERIPGPYAIVLRNTAGTELARYPFTPVTLEERGNLQTATKLADNAPALLISELVPYVAGSDRVDIEGPTDLLKSVTAGPNAPTITITGPNAGQAITDKQITIAWTASDPDRDVLT